MSHIIVDWGTTSFRAFRVQGVFVTEKVEHEGKGVLSVTDHEKAFNEMIPQHWGEKLVYVVGMGGSSVGWKETAYVSTPAGLQDLKEGLKTKTQSNGRDIYFLPGVCHGTESPDVMRGEEVQALGVGKDGVFVCPGTHSKWIKVSNGKIVSFSTLMSGDIFQAVGNHTILKKSIVSRTHDEAWFAKGVMATGPFLGNLFKVRRASLSKSYKGNDSAANAYLSGILVGEEIRSQLPNHTPRVTIIGSTKLCNLYKTAFSLLGKVGTIENIPSETAILAGVRGVLPKPEIPRIIAILRGVVPEEVVSIGEALVASGVTGIEVPLNSPNPFESIRRLVQAFKHQDNILIGAGTVLTPADVDRVADVGGRLIISPNTNPLMIQRAVSKALVTIPGVYTPTDALMAAELGVDGVKLFPAETLGPKGLKAIKVVLPKTLKTFAVGGVNLENMAEWRAAGAYGFGVGSSLYKPGSTPAEVKERALKYTAATAKL